MNTHFLIHAISRGFIYLLFALLVGGYAVTAEAAPLTLTGDTHATSSVGVASPISLQISGAAASTTPINLVVSNGTLSITNTGGLTFNTGLSASTINFEGTVEDINEALLTLTYTRGGTGSDTLEVSLVNEGEVFFPDTGNLYEYISSTLTWTQARDAAALLTRYGAAGYLTTITSQGENDFVADRLANAGWMGASDSVSEGVWRWVTGPENGTQFWTGAAGGSAFGGNYENWNIGEPNDSSSNEDCGQFLAGGSGQWNDLPCSVTTLPGYVAEFGATGDEVEVASTDISIVTVSSPTVVAFSPLDNATGVAIEGDLVLEFSTNIATNTGNITVYKSSDDSVVETISATSSQIVIAGDTATITLSEELEEGTAYYIQISNTTFRNLSAVNYLGITNKTTWNFTTGDFTAPTISAVLADEATTTATITWTTDENASSKVVYGPATTLELTTAESDTAPRVTAHEVDLTSLLPCTNYYYRVVSRDAALNAATSSQGTFTTVGCESSEVPTAATSTPVQSSSGGSTSLTEDSTSITVTAPSNFTSTSSSVVIQISALSSASILESIGVPSALPEAISGILFDVKAIIDGDTILDSFDAPITIRYTYTDADVVGIREASLWLYHYHDGDWEALDNCSLNQTTNTISCTTDSFSLFSLFGAEASTGNGGGGGRTGCGDKNAINYKKNVGHDATRCVYATGDKTTTPAPVIPTSGYSFTRDLMLGSAGEDVRDLQIFLNSQNFTLTTVGIGSAGSESNYFGSLTKEALARFQSAKGISPAVGYFGPRTRAFISDTAIALPVSPSASTTPAVIITTNDTFTRDLTGGDSGDDVKRLQNFLMQAGYHLESGATGYFGTQTKSALATFQTDKGIIPANGYFGPKTRALISGEL